MKRVAIPISRSELSEFFGRCNYYEIFEIEKDVVDRKMVELPEGVDITGLPEWLKSIGVTDVIAYKVDKKIIALFASNKVNLFVGIAKKNPDDLIADYLAGKLVSDKDIIDEITNN